ncbi:condensation domain-containing protein [Nostoc sp.]|uniref:condensation domain-containing protein n=1 Tax=Nostoc sp. TaxID=1180 RepID=UPI002FF91866
MRVRCSLSLEVVEQSLNEIVRRHENLRTVFTVINDQPMQIVLPYLHLPLIYENLQHLPPEARESEAVPLGIKVRQQPFNLAVAPLIRTALFQLNPKEYWLVITMHHLIADGWSFGVLQQEFQLF